MFRVSYIKTQVKSLGIYQTELVLWLKNNKLVNCSFLSGYNYSHFSTNYNVNFSNKDGNLINLYRSVPRSVDELQEVLRDEAVSPTESKLLKIAIIGVPNSGKSTLINKLVGWRVCSVSQKVHTTRCNTRAIRNVGSTQLVFLDTPGTVTHEEIKKHQLRGSLVRDPEMSLQTADCIGVLHDVSNKYTRNQLNPRILRLLALYPSIPSVLILNKVDLLKKKNLLLELTVRLTEGLVGDKKLEFSRIGYQLGSEQLKDKVLKKYFKSDNYPTGEGLSNVCPEKDYAVKSTDNSIDNSEISEIMSDKEYKQLRENLVDTSFTPEDVYCDRIKLVETQVQEFIKDKVSWPKFEEVFMISALEGTGVDILRNYFVASAQPGSWIFSDEVVTDQTPQEIALSAVREKCLDHLSHNVPYELDYKIVYWDLNEAEVLIILMNVMCYRKSHMKLIVGKGGSKVARIAKEAEQELRNTFRSEVRLKINFEWKPVPVEKK